MERYFNKNEKNIQFVNKELEMQIIEWWAKDEMNDSVNDDSCSDNEEQNDLTYSIYCFGRSKCGKSVTCKINNYHPFYYIKIPDTRQFSLNTFLSFVQSKLYKNKSSLLKEKCKIVEKKDLFGFRDNKLYKYVKLVFKNISTMNKSKYIFKNTIQINRINNKAIKYKLYEASFDPFLRFCHINDIQTANWVKIKNFKTNIIKKSITDIYIEIENSSNNIQRIDVPTIANFLQASWDIEVYSFDGEFPEAKKKDKYGKFPNVIYQMATTFKYFNDKEVFVKHLFTLKKCSEIKDKNTIVEYCETEKDLIKKWIDMIKKTDPDIIYTYNGDSFDWKYLTDRCELLDLKDYLFTNLSRLKTFNADIKREFFSSSAYGDSEFNRVYIPGRLNYDLLIHYKRGMKKYSSYKLDFIAGEILNEKKNDVTAKDIFKYYEDGCPDKIKKIGEYCIQDTALLQKLVDKQLILITIIQLANVTYVPIGYLVTRGQTIKVTSQLLRKARQMDFLVPNTNFNEDSYPIQIKLKGDIIAEDIFKQNEYIQVFITMKNKTTSYNSGVLNCKLSEIVDNDLILLTNTELDKIYYNVKIITNGKTYIAEKVWSINDTIDDTFTGACVLEPQIGFTNNDIAVLDFASLYPTIIISRNLCYSTFLMDNQFMNCKNTIYENMKWQDSVEYKLNHKCDTLMKSGKKKNELCGRQAYFEVDGKYACRVHDPLKKIRDENEKYQKKDVEYDYTVVQPSKDENGNLKNKGVLPALLEELYAERKKVKKRMAIANDNGDKLLADILDCTQLGIKISLNSCYGFLGRRVGDLILKELGSIVTSVGRQLIEQSKAYAENDFLEYIKKEKILTHKIMPKKYDLTKDEKETFLKHFKIK
jgi:DNA polymerase elongation subunit (family B)